MSWLTVGLGVPPILYAFVEYPLDLVVIEHHDVGFELRQFGNQNVPDLKSRQFLLLYLLTLTLLRIGSSHRLVSSFQTNIVFVCRLG